ncbi:MAG: MerR family transcriptional regulator [Micromonosporaceae bacterium]|nr:MerR family transcriptional regulator [Micromonosporaceae bacterium]
MKPSPAALTIGQLGRKYGLSRSTLLYYDRIKILTPSGRSAAGYRRYAADDDARLARICRYRRAGLPLDTIRDVLDAPDADLAEILAERLETLDCEIRRLRQQQRFIMAYLADARAAQDRAAQDRAAQGHASHDQAGWGRPFMTADRFVELLEVAGVSREQRHAWHVAFERQSATEHQAFLEFLCLPDDAIMQIRDRSRLPGDEAADRPADRPAS